MRAILIALLSMVAAAVLAQNSAYKQDDDWQAPPDAISKTNPLASKPELASGGKKLFQRHCSVCHGTSGEGIKNAADLQLDTVQQQSDGVLHWKITNGNPRRGMPSFSAIPDLQRWQIVLYLRTLPKSKAPPQP